MFPVKTLKVMLIITENVWNEVQFEHINVQESL